MLPQLAPQTVEEGDLVAAVGEPPVLNALPQLGACNRGVPNRVKAGLSRGVIRRARAPAAGWAAAGAGGRIRLHVRSPGRRG